MVNAAVQSVVKPHGGQIGTGSASRCGIVHAPRADAIGSQWVRGRRDLLTQAVAAVTRFASPVSMAATFLALVGLREWRSAIHAASL
jgi:hypothetical protein